MPRLAAAGPKTRSKSATNVGRPPAKPSEECKENADDSVCARVDAQEQFDHALQAVARLVSALLDQWRDVQREVSGLFLFFLGLELEILEDFLQTRPKEFVKNLLTKLVSSWFQFFDFMSVDEHRKQYTSFTAQYNPDFLLPFLEKGASLVHAQLFDSIQACFLCVFVIQLFRNVRKSFSNSSKARTGPSA